MAMFDAERRAQVAKCCWAYRERMVQEGRCAYCGAVRELNDGGTKHRCPPCHAKQKAASTAYRNAYRGETDWSKYAGQKRAHKAAQRAKQMARNKCVLCGKGRHTNDLRYCLTCRLKENARTAAYRQRKRKRNDAARAGGVQNPNIRPWPVGAAVPRLVGGHSFRIGMDRPTKEAILNLLRAYRKSQWDQGKMPRSHQISRMVREAILRWERRPGDYPKVCPLRPHRLVVEKLSVRLDARTRATVRFQAQAHNRSEAAALRAILCSAAAPRRAWAARARNPLLSLGRQEGGDASGKFFTVRVRGDE